jgi:hypothetical protein
VHLRERRAPDPGLRPGRLLRRDFAPFFFGPANLRWRIS